MRAWDDGFARRALYSIVQSSGREQLGQTFELVGINQCRESTGVAGYSLFLDVHLGSFGIRQHSQKICGFYYAPLSDSIIEEQRAVVRFL